MFALANVRVEIGISGDGLQEISGKLVSIDFTTEPNRQIQKHLKIRNWRKLRQRLVALDVRDLGSVTRWLNDAGYARSVGTTVGLWSKMGPDLDSTLRWTGGNVTSDTVRWLNAQQDVIAWLIKLSASAFSKAVARAWEQIEYKQNRRGAALDADFRGNTAPNVTLDNSFLSDLKAPSHLDPKLVEKFLAGAGRAPNLHGLIHWPDNDPVLTIYADTPIEAIGISIHLDRQSSKNGWVKCKCGCGNWFEKKRSTSRFYSTECRNNFITKERRRKIRLVEKGYAAWKFLSATKRKRCDFSVWIAKWATSKSRIRLDPTWVRKVVARMNATTR